MDDFELEIKNEFIKEALMNLEEVESSFMELESASDTKPLLDKIFRLAHNLKGGSRAVGFGEVAEFTHQLESLVLKIQKGEVGLNPEIITTLLKANDRLVLMLTGLKSNLSATFDNADIIAELIAWLEGRTVGASGDSPPEKSAPDVFDSPSESVAVSAEPDFSPINTQPDARAESPAASSGAWADFPADGSSENDNLGDNLTGPANSLETSNPLEDADASPETSSEIHKTPKVEAIDLVKAGGLEPKLKLVSDEPKVEKKKADAPAGKSPEQSQKKDDEIIRVNLSRIDMLNDYVGELIVLQSVVQQQSTGSNPVKLQTSIRQMVKLAKDIQNLSMSLRMLPVKPLIQKLQRVVRDTARVLDKDVNLDVVGDQIDIDKSVLDQLADPLIHILRNAVDHGLEMPSDRKANGKNPQGRVTLIFRNEGNHLVIEILDDGKGINGEVLRKKAIEKHVISETHALTDKQLINLIFHPGFSTKSETSEISGRGVGMDVVKTNVEKIGGQVEVTTTIGQGSVFRLQIPLSLAVIEGLVITTENHRYVVPLNQVQETINLKSHKVFSSQLGIGSCFELRGTVVPLFSLDDAMGAKKALLNTDDTALIISVGERLMALVVRDIIRSQQIVIKPFGNGITPQKGWIGTCVLGDGLPTLIVSPVDLLNGKVVQSFGEQHVGEAA